MNQQTVYQTVSVQDELPEKDGAFCVIKNDQLHITTYDKGIRFGLSGGDRKWLKPTTGYFFTPEEFREAARKLYDAGHDRGSDEVNVLKPDGHIFPDFQTFYNQLTESK